MTSNRNDKEKVLRDLRAVGMSGSAIAHPEAQKLYKLLHPDHRRRRTRSERGARSILHQSEGSMSIEVTLYYQGVSDHWHELARL